MGKLYVKQPFKIRLETKQDLTGASAVIKCRKPGDNSTEILDLAANIVDIENGVIEASVTTAQNNSVGKWKAWAYITFADNSEVPGEPVQFTIHAEGH